MRLEVVVTTYDCMRWTWKELGISRPGTVADLETQLI